MNSVSIQLQDALELASMCDGGVGNEDKSTSIKSISDSIQWSIACWWSNKASALAASGSRQLSICKNERKGATNEPEATLLLEGEDAAGEADVAIGRKKIDHADHDSSERLNGCRTLEHESEDHPRKAAPWPSSLVHAHQAYQVGGVLGAVIDWPAVATLMRQPAWLFNARVEAGSTSSYAASMNVSQ
jgi:hypothetical protein